MTINTVPFPFGLEWGSMQLNVWDVGQEVQQENHQSAAFLSRFCMVADHLRSGVSYVNAHRLIS